MPIYYIDPEHARVAADPTSGAAHRTKLGSVCNRVATLAGLETHLVRYDDLSDLDLANADALIIGGCTTDWSDYDMDAFHPLLQLIRTAPRPILGICAGHQLIGRAYGACWGPLEPLQLGESDPDPTFAPGFRKQRGFMPVEIDPDGALFRGLPTRMTVFQSHYWQLTMVPEGFLQRAWSAWSPIQAIEHRDRPVFGIQFHAERYDSDHPDGARILERFFSIARQ
jgi:GMP synthase-like glutamine amidotransferase